MVLRNGDTHAPALLPCDSGDNMAHPRTSLSDGSGGSGANLEARESVNTERRVYRTFSTKRLHSHHVRSVYPINRPLRHVLEKNGSEIRLMGCVPLRDIGTR